MHRWSGITFWPFKFINSRINVYSIFKHYFHDNQIAILTNYFTRACDNAEIQSVVKRLAIFPYVVVCGIIARGTWVQSQAESYQRLKKWYLMPPCLTLSIMRYGSRVKWSNPGKGVAPSTTPWCSKLSKREPSDHPRL